MSKLTPMMRQYMDIKDKYPDAFVLFRLGDFYEVFGDDAHTVAAELGIVLTGRDAGESGRVPMCGVPYHAIDGYIATLATAGHKLVLVDQVEDPRLAKGLVKREVVRVITPGTYTDRLEPGRNNYAMALVRTAAGWGLAFCDVSTGELMTTQADGASPDAVKDEIGRIQPSECVFPGSAGDVCPISGIPVAYPRPASEFDLNRASSLLKEQLGVASLEGFGASGMDLAVRAAGGLVAYLRETQMGNVPQVRTIRLYHLQDFMRVDAAARRALDVSSSQHSLVRLMDKACTAMGSRQLRAWLERPSVDLGEISARHGAVEELKSNVFLLADLRDSMQRVHDLQRTASKLASRRAGPRDLLSLAQSLEGCSLLRDRLMQAQVRSALLADVAAAIDGNPNVVSKIRAAISDDAPVSVGDGNVVRAGYSADVDELRRARTEGQQWLLELEARERERTGIKSLKVGFNQVFGYYIEVSRANAHLVPGDYVRKQTLVNAERYVSDELKQLETKLLGAEERLSQLESAIFGQIVDEVAAHLPSLLDTAAEVAVLDVVCAYAEVARANNYVRPEMGTARATVIKGARHPVLEQMLGPGRYVASDIDCDHDAGRLLIITGPNMAGKSTVLATVGLLTLMAQAGSFVPATSASMGVCDAIYYRTGSYDELGMGKSSFMVETLEMANVLNTATDRSLILVDELGRGTSTYDGMALAWAVAEYIHDRIGARTFFTTHYHELAALEERLPFIRNYHVGAVERGGELTFCYRLERGSVDRSYGLNVARMAGMPSDVLKRANQLLREMQKQGAGQGNQMTLFGWDNSSVPASAQASDEAHDDSAAREIEADEAAERLRAAVSEINPDDLTPRDALRLIYELKAMCTAAAGSADDSLGDRAGAGSGSASASDGDGNGEGGR